MTAQTELVDKVIEQIKLDLEAGDTTALVELLMNVPVKYLRGFLPEDVHQSYRGDLK